MKVESGLQSQAMSKQIPKLSQQNRPEVKKFDSLFYKSEKMGEQIGEKTKLQQMIESIDALKETLQHDITVENLREYKEAVRSFLDYYTKNELQMQNIYIRDQRGYEEKLSMIQSIDKKLNQLTENRLETHKGHLEMLRKIGEINGLVVNFFA